MLDNTSILFRPFTKLYSNFSIYFSFVSFPDVMAKLCDDDVNILTIEPISIKPESAHGSGSLHISTIQEENGATVDSESPLFNVPDEICYNGAHLLVQRPTSPMTH